MSFQLRNIPLLSRIGADRADELRSDVEAAVAGWIDAHLLRVDDRGNVMVTGDQLVLGAAAARSPTNRPATRCSWAGWRTAATCGRCGRRWRPGRPSARAVDPRRAGIPFDDVSAQLVACALALLNWHDAARFSPADGSPTRPIRAGWARRNLLTGREEFPGSTRR